MKKRKKARRNRRANDGNGRNRVKHKELGSSSAEEFIIIKSLINSPDWPYAVDPDLICSSSNQDKDDRAEGILEILVEESLEGRKFLDWGCGEGHVAFKALDQRPAISVGYDIVAPTDAPIPFEDTNLPNFLLTTDFAKVTENGPYDTILLYDVLDHAQEPIDILSKANELLAPEGALIVRCHPFCSRHGGHQYQIINKAFLHLVLTKEELEELGITTPNVEVLRPISTYRDWINQAGLEAAVENINRQIVENFFSETELVAKRIMAKFGKDKMPLFQMEQSFVDYTFYKT